MRKFKKCFITGITGSGGSYSGIANTNSKVAIGHRLDNTNYDLDGDMTDIMYWNDYCWNSLI